MEADQSTWPMAAQKWASVDSSTGTPYSRQRAAMRRQLGSEPGRLWGEELFSSTAWPPAFTALITAS